MSNIISRISAYSQLYLESRIERHKGNMKQVEHYKKELQEVDTYLREQINKEENVESFLDAAISEINYALNSNKSKEVKEVYLKNAIRYINTAKEKLEGKENKHG